MTRSVAPTSKPSVLCPAAEPLLAAFGRSPWAVCENFQGSAWGAGRTLAGCKMLRTVVDGEVRHDERSGIVDAIGLSGRVHDFEILEFEG